MGPIGCALYSHEFYETDLQRGFKRGVHLQVTREEASLLLQAARLDPAWGREAQRLLREEFRHSMAVLVMAEDLPEMHNRVTLTDRTDVDGIPAVKIEYNCPITSAAAWISASTAQKRCSGPPAPIAPCACRWRH